MSQLLVRSACAEFLGTYALSLASCGSVAAVGSFSYQFDYGEMTVGRTLCRAVAMGTVRRVRACSHERLVPFLAPPHPDPYVSLSLSLFLSKQAYAAMLSSLKAVGESITAQWSDWSMREALRFPVGHCNPVVTMAVFGARGVPPQAAMAYILAQLLGGTFAAVTLAGLVPGARAARLGTPVPDALATPWQAALMETVLTYGLVLLLLLLFVRRTRGLSSPLTHGAAPILVGMYVALASLIGTGVSGCSMNPATSLGSALVSGVWTSHWVYWVGPYLAATLSLLTYRSLFL
jgi:glycerol uptake facilitator-like aquaporin